MPDGMTSLVVAGRANAETAEYSDASACRASAIPATRPTAGGAVWCDGGRTAPVAATAPAVTPTPDGIAVLLKCIASLIAHV